MAVFTMDPEAVRQKTKMLESLAEEYDTMRSNLLKTATSMGAAYESADNKSYVANITEFCSQMKEVSDRLRNAAQIITTEAANITRTESDNAAQAKKLP